MTRPTIRAADLDAGHALPGFDHAFTSVDLVAYGAATWDWHRLHYDADFARSMGLPAPIVDGQQFGAMFAKQAMRWAGPRAFLAAMDLRMKSMAFAGDTVSGEAHVAAVEPGDGHDTVVLEQRLLKAGKVVAEATTRLRLPR